MQHIPLVDRQKVGQHQREGNKEKPNEEQSVVNDQLTGTLVLMTGDADDWLMTGDANFQETRSSIKKKKCRIQDGISTPLLQRRPSL